MEFTLSILPYFALVMFWLSVPFFFLFLWSFVDSSPNHWNSLVVAIGSLIIALLSGILLKLVS